MNDLSKKQVWSLSEATLRAYAPRGGLPEDDVPKLMRLQNSHQLDDPKIRELVLGGRPYMGRVFETWNSATLGNFTLTSVGIAIGHANIKKHAGEFTDLSLWIQ